MKARHLIPRSAATVKRRAAIADEVAEGRDLQRESGSPPASSVGRRSTDARRDTGIPVVQESRQKSTWRWRAPMCGSLKLCRPPLDAVTCCWTWRRPSSAPCGCKTPECVGRHRMCNTTGCLSFSHCEAKNMNELRQEGMNSTHNVCVQPRPWSPNYWSSTDAEWDL